MMNEKNTIRSEIRRQAELRNERWRRQSSEAILRRLERLDAFERAASVALYWSLPGEVFTHDLVERWSRSKRIYLPVMQGDGLILKRFTDRNDLREARFGVQEPVTGETAGPGDMELIVVPGVAFDRQGKRLGHGKGFYDRLLALPGWGGAKRLALVHSLQLAAFPAGPLDIPMHGYATEKELIWL